MMDFLRLPLFGTPFEHVETYFEYEGIRTFAMRSTRLPLYYIANCVDESEEDDTLTFLFVAVGPARFEAVRSGVVPFRDAFSEALAQGLHSVTWDFSREDISAPVVRTLHIDEVPLPWLPAADARLNLKTKTTAAFDHDEIQTLSAAQGRSVFAVEVESQTSNITEFPTKYAGRLQIAIQGQIDALAQEHLGGNHHDVQTTVIGLRAASFVVVFAVDAGEALFERRDLTQEVFTQFQSLLSVAAQKSPGAMVKTLLSHTRRVRLRFRDLLEPLVRTGSGIALNTALVGANSITTSRLSSESVKVAFDAIEHVTPITEKLELSRAILTGLTLRTKRFELIDAASMKIYKGSMTDDALMQADGLTVSNSSFVSAVMRMEVAFAGEDAESEAKYFLERIEATPGGE
ncbi:hypothetical protein [Pseudarthrobacter sp. N5]|uniref:hypothetical protein n=1 Tax=Pseudarthrobacter sp. N5 TaxID=3418416 RepID=UPI003CEA2C9C